MFPDELYAQLDVCTALIQTAAPSTGPSVGRFTALPLRTAEACRMEIQLIPTPTVLTSILLGHV